MKYLSYFFVLSFASPALVLAQDNMTDTEIVVAKFQIQEVMYKYALYHNTDNPQAYANLFTEDADFMGFIRGREAILEMAKGEVTKMAKLGISLEGEHKFGFMRTQIINPIVEVVDSNHAKGFSYLQVIVPNVDSNNIPTILFEGTYQDEFEKVNGVWLISSRRSYGNMNYPGLGSKLGLGPSSDE